MLVKQYYELEVSNKRCKYQFDEGNLEIFNLLQVQNTVSYTWIQDVTGNRYAIPNYLTNRQVNVRLQIKF